MGYEWIVYVVAAVVGFFWGARNFGVGVRFGLIVGVAMLLVFVIFDDVEPVSTDGVAPSPVLVEK